jgi:hypothetical protein
VRRGAQFFQIRHESFNESRLMHRVMDHFRNGAQRRRSAPRTAAARGLAAGTTGYIFSDITLNFRALSPHGRVAPTSLAH